jgi:hypothetical protein
MKIFNQEIIDGLEEIIKSSASLSYASIAEPCLINNSQIKHIKSLASYDDSDLYYVQSILVSSSWNKNDDIFSSKEVWIARNTPEDKPTNLEHDENIIIGHITANWPITEEGILIDENTPVENLPEKYHILTGSVIYKGFSSADLRERSQKLISEIENGTKFVSMECFFNGFDYGLIDEASGDFKTLTRNDNTAYLTKYLRAYGGTGKHENYKIGRILRNITFSGKGFVDKPANPDSIIFTKDTFNKILNEKKDDLSKTGVSKSTLTSNAENNIMSLDLEPVMKEVAEIKAKIEAMSCAETVKEAFASTIALKDQTIELENTIKANEILLTETKASFEAALFEKEEAAKKMAEEMTKKEEEMKKVKSELDTANETIAMYMKKEEEMAKKEKKMKRMATLIETGIDTDTASATVDKFESLTDDAFEAMTSLFAGKMPPWLNKDKKDEEVPEKKKASEETVDASDLENVETEDSINLSVGGDSTSHIDTTRAELLEFVCARLGKKLNKGE